MTADVLDRALAWVGQQQAPMEQLIAELVDISSHTPDRDGNIIGIERSGDRE